MMPRMQSEIIPFIFSASLILFFLLFFSSVALAQPKISFSQDVFDFGDINQGEVVKKTITIKNVGSEKLEILKVAPSCGCTVSTLKKDVLLAQEETSLDVEFDSKGFSGNKVKTVRIYTNDPANQTKLLTLKGNILAEVNVDPPRIYFGDIYPESSDKSAYEKEVVVRVRADAKATLGDVKSRSKWISYVVNAESEKEKTISIRLDPKITLGEFRDRLVIEVNNSDQKTVNLPIYASVKRNMTVTPQVLSFGMIDDDRLRTKILTVTNHGNGGVKFLEAKTDYDGLTARLDSSASSSANNSDLLIEVTLDPKNLKKDLKTTIALLIEKAEGEGVSTEEVTLNVTAVLPAVIPALDSP